MKYMPINQYDRNFGETYIKERAINIFERYPKEEIEKLQVEADKFGDIEKVYQFAEYCYANDDYMQALYYITIAHQESLFWFKPQEIMFKLSLEKVINKAEEISRNGFGYEVSSAIKFEKKYDGVNAEYDYLWRLYCNNDSEYRLVDYVRDCSIASYNSPIIDKWKIYLVKKGESNKLLFVNIYLNPNCDFNDIVAPEGFRLHEYKPMRPKKIY